ncbi:MAG: TonB-dependent receptor plug domain-containing protein, partial [Pseudomonadota bacterium]
MRLLGASVAAIAAAVGQSNAQDNSASLRLDVIEVTTQKRTESIVDVPISVTAYDNDTLRQLGVSQFDELSVFVPGLLVQEQSPNNPGFVIRGITSDSGEANIEPRVAVFQDGVSLSRSRGSYVELFDLERVEVVKGPQPTLFGRSALIGAVSIVQNKADVNSYNGYAEVGYGNRGQFKAEGAVNAPILPGVFGVRAAGIHKERDGIVSNPLEGQGDLNGVNLDAFPIAA